MGFSRLFNILRANMNSGKVVPETEQEPIKQTWTETPERETIMDPLKKKELEYLSNLELTEGAGFEQIKAAYKNLIKKYHPDKFNTNEQQRKLAGQVTSRLNEAFAYFEKKYKR